MLRANVTRRRAHVAVALLLLAVLPLAPFARLAAQKDSVASAAQPRDASRYWRHLVAGAATSILLHEAGHVITARAIGGHPSFGFDKLRPTIYSGLDASISPHRQFLFSASGLVVQSLIDEGILDLPHARGNAFERGLLAGGIGTTLFYLTIGRTGSVSDIEFMARVHGMTKTQSTLAFGSLIALQSFRIAHDTHYANFFTQPTATGMKLGVNVSGW